MQHNEAQGGLKVKTGIKAGGMTSSPRPQRVRRAA